MTLAKKNSSILKMSTKLPLAGKSSQVSFAKNDKFSIRRSGVFRPLPPSLLKLPTMSSSSNSCDAHSPMLSLDLELNDTTLDEWLVRLDKEARKSVHERSNSTDDITRSVSKFSFATSSSKSKSISANSFFDRHQQQQPAMKRRRFARRNSFVVRDAAQLSRIAEQCKELETMAHR